MVFAVIGLAVALIGAVSGLIVCITRSATQRKRFSAIVDVDGEVARLRSVATLEVAQLKAAATYDVIQLKEEAARLRAAAAAEAESIRRTVQGEREQHARLANETAQVQAHFERLSDELRKIEGSLEDISFGLYKPQYNFDTPEQFKAEMDRVHDRQKEMVRAGNAASFAVSWTVGDSKRDGERMQKQYCKLLLRAFNGECDAAIAKVAWNNASRMEERIRKAFDAINQLGQVMTVTLSPGYRELKLAELHLEHELAEKKREIVDEQRRIREQMRDEERSLHEAEKAQADAEAEEVRFQKALEKAKVELSKARGEEHGRLNEKILELQNQLADARARSVRAKSLAEMTRAGYVYVISNIGSFGEQVFKIGMTRRLEPMDRVRELGAASVPFPFDVHAMVYSEDAPALETAFHQRFKDRSVNLVNLRKEFFHVDIAELEAFAKQRGLTIAFTKLAEAREYRESAAMRLARGSGPTTMPTSLQDRVAMTSALAQFSSRPGREERPSEARSPLRQAKPS
jgi:multidrug efflux pump subunit AcrA (membrane-fusion protein)